MQALTKSVLVAKVGARHRSLTHGEADAAVNVILDNMVEALSRGARVEIRGFGSFALKHRAARLGRNPRTGESVEVPAKWVPHFKAGKEMREALNRAKVAQAGH